MKIPLTSYKQLFTAISIFFAIAATCNGQVIASNEPADFDTEISTPTVSNKQSGALRRIMTSNAQSLIDQGFNVELMRNDQVIAVTIPLDQLFAPNQTQLLPDAADKISALLSYTRHYGKYKILLAIHSDDTGSATYKNWLCEQRIISLYDYFDTNGNSPSMVFGYPMSDTQPIADNNSRKNRALNRRLEVYIVPGTELLSGLKNR